jgi:hypothetical protein
VKFESDFTREFYQALLDIVVDVFNRRIVGRRNSFRRDLVETFEHRGQLGVRQHSSLREGAGMRLARRHLVGQKNAIERKRPLPLFEFRVQLLAEAARPHLHFTTSDF